MIFFFIQDKKSKHQVEIITILLFHLDQTFF